MYVATRPLKVKDGNSVRVVPAGGYVPEATDWPLSVLRSHLRLDLLRLVPEGVSAEPVKQVSQPAAVMPQAPQASAVSVSVQQDTKGKNKKNKRR
jgi:hypothetical protein